MILDLDHIFEFVDAMEKRLLPIQNCSNFYRDGADKKCSHCKNLSSICNKVSCPRVKNLEIPKYRWQLVREKEDAS